MHSDVYGPGPCWGTGGHLGRWASKGCLVKEGRGYKRRKETPKFERKKKISPEEARMREKIKLLSLSNGGIAIAFSACKRAARKKQEKNLSGNKEAGD